MKKFAAIVLTALVLCSCGAQAKVAGTGGNGPATSSAAVTRTWPTQWCKARIGMTRSQMAALMGAPSKSFSLASGTPQESWQFADFQLNAFMDNSDRVRQLDINDSMMTAAEKAEFHCSSTRVSN